MCLTFVFRIDLFTLHPVFFFSCLFICFSFVFSDFPPLLKISGPADLVCIFRARHQSSVRPKSIWNRHNIQPIRNPLWKICACAVPTYQTRTDAHKSHVHSTHENLLIYMHGNNANRTGRKGPKIHKHGVLKTGGVTADKAAAALKGAGTWTYQL